MEKHDLAKKKKNTYKIFGDAKAMTLLLGEMEKQFQFIRHSRKTPRVTDAHKLSQQYDIAAIPKWLSPSSILSPKQHQILLSPKPCKIHLCFTNFHCALCLQTKSKFIPPKKLTLSNLYELNFSNHHMDPMLVRFLQNQLYTHTHTHAHRVYIYIYTYLHTHT